MVQQRVSAASQRQNELAPGLHFFTGKGGVGKSSLVAATAMRAAAMGRNPLIVELGRRSTMEKIFNVADVAFEPTRLAPGVFGMNMLLEPALAAYIKSFVKVPGVAKRVVKNRALSRFFRAAPAVHEVATLHRIKRLLSEQRFDPIVIDLEATGHALMFLHVPQTFERIVPSGVFRRVMDGFASVLKDAAQSRLHVVTLPLQLPVTETMELIDALREQRSIALGNVFLNRVPRDSIETIGEAELTKLCEQDRMVYADAFQAQKTTSGQRERLLAAGLPVTVVHQADPPLSLEMLGALGEEMWP